MVPPTGPSLPNRRVRSRHGCKNCKSRKIKCDESHPRCGNCLDRDLACSFTPPLVAAAPSQPKMAISRLAVPPRHQARPSTALSLSPTLEHILYRGQPVEARMIELRVLKFFQYRSRDPNIFTLDPQLPADGLLRLAFNHEFLMDTVLALTASTMRLYQPVEQALIGACHGFIARSIQKQRQAIGCGLQLKSFDAVYMNSLLIAAVALMQHQFVPLEKDDGQDLQQWLRAFQGLGVIANTSGENFGKSKVASALPLGRWQDPIQDQLKAWPGILTGVVYQALTAGLRSLHPDLSLDQYLPVITYLSLASQLPTRHLITRLMFDPDPVFITLLSQGDTVARLLLGVYFAIWDTVSVEPWMDIIARRDLRLIFRLLPAPDAQLLQKVIDTILAQDK